MTRHALTCLIVTAAGMVCGVHAHAQDQAASDRVAVAQPESDRPVPVHVDAGMPIAGQVANELFSHRRSFDQPVPPPEHPPLDQIPPMPMPESAPDDDADEPPIPDGQRWANLEGGVSFFDSTTGEWYELPARVPTGLPGAESAEGEYWGVAPHDPTEEFGRNFGTMSPAGSLSTWPRSGNVKLAMRFTDQNGVQRWYSCSGTMADAGVVLTAAHCVYARNPNGVNIFDWADIIYIYPAWDGDGSIFPAGSGTVYDNFGYAYGSQYLAGTNYINNGDFDSDAGLIRINRNGSRNVGMLTGWFSWAWGYGCGTIQDRTYHNFSYPAENCGGSLHTGRTMYYWLGDFDSCPGNQLQLDTSPGCLTAVWGGMSGSGAYYIDGDSRHVHAVCSNSNRSTRGRYAKLWETFVNDMVTFENNTRTNSEDWEPLMFRARGSTTVRAGETMNDICTFQMVNATNANPPDRSYTARVYLSTNNTISASDTLLATWIWSGNFGAMANVTFNVPAPHIPIDTPPGNYWLGVVIDPAIPGTDTNDSTNAWDAQPITVTLGLPGSASGPSPANNATNVGTNADLDWANAPRASTYRVHFGTTNPPPFVGQVAGSAWTLPALNYDTRYYWRIDTVNSSGTTTGAVWNFRTRRPPAPDLSAELANAPSGAFYRGQSINVTHRTRNVGDTASTGTTVQFRASTNSTISASDPLLDTRNFPGLGVNGVLQTTTSIQIPQTLPPGTYYIGTMVSEPSGADPDSSNNWVADTNTITVQVCQADLAAPWGVLNFFDLSTFMNRFNSHDPSADLAAPFGTFNFFDVAAYMSMFNSGCP